MVQEEQGTPEELQRGQQLGEEALVVEYGKLDEVKTGGREWQGCVTGSRPCEVCQSESGRRKGQAAGSRVSRSLSPAKRNVVTFL